jgi:phosphoglycolate phosphatase
VSSRAALRGVVFDLDGTLIDSRRDIAEAANYTLERAGLARLSHAELESYVGDGAPSLISRAARLPVQDPRTTAMVADFLDYYALHPLDHTALMPGAQAALDALSAWPLGICTNKARRTTLVVLDGLGLTQRFRAVVAGDDLPERKPHPAMVHEAARQLGLAASEVAMVGDGPQDIESGRAAGAFTIGVRGGILAEERLVASAPDLVLASLADLPGALLRLGSAR